MPTMRRTALIVAVVASSRRVPRRCTPRSLRRRRPTITTIATPANLTVAHVAAAAAQTIDGFGASGAWWPNDLVKFPPEGTEARRRHAVLPAGHRALGISLQHRRRRCRCEDAGSGSEAGSRRRRRSDVPARRQRCGTCRSSPASSTVRPRSSRRTGGRAAAVSNRAAKPPTRSISPRSSNGSTTTTTSRFSTSAR